MTTDASVADAPPHTNGSSRLATVTRSFESLIAAAAAAAASDAASAVCLLPESSPREGKEEEGSGRNKMTDVCVSVLLVVSLSSRRQNFPHLVEPFHWLLASFGGWIENLESGVSQSAVVVECNTG
jgi:hypothetical protein